MNVFRNVSFVALAVVLLFGKNSHAANKCFENIGNNKTSAPLGLIMSGSILNKAGYKKIGDRFAKAGMVGGLYGVAFTDSASHKGVGAVVVVDVVLHELLARIGKTEIGESFTDRLPEFIKSDVAQDVLCGLAAVAVGTKVDGIAKGKCASL